MSANHDSYRRIIKSTMIMGGATVAAILISVTRSKILALLVGPTGIGLIGLFTSIMATATAIGGMGLHLSGVRELATNPERRGLVRMALWSAIWPLAGLTAAVLWFGRFEISRWVIGNESQAFAVGLMGLAAALAIIATAQVAVIQGSGRVADVARIQVAGALLSLLLGIPAVFYLGPIGIALAVMAIPVGTVVAALPFRVPSERAATGLNSATLVDEWRRLLKLGATVMVVISLQTGALVVVRTLVVKESGLESAGLYHAAYAISALNAQLVLSAMATDYFPRLAGTESDRKVSSSLVNDQLHAALLLASPILLGMAAVAPLVLHLLYTSAFAPAADLLRWQLTGELLKLPGWAFGFLLLARADKSRYLLVEMSCLAIFVLGTFALLPQFGLAGAGISYAAGYLVYSLLVVRLCNRLHAAGLKRENLIYLLAVTAALISVALLGQSWPWLAAAVGLLASAAAALHAFHHLSELREQVRPKILETPGPDAS